MKSCLLPVLPPQSPVWLRRRAEVGVHDQVLFRSGSYRSNALHPHQRLHERAQLTPAHFARWLTLWRAAVDDRFRGPKAQLAKLSAERIAGSMSRRITGHAVATDSFLP